MKPLHSLPILAGLLFTGLASAQFPLLHTSNEQLTPLRSLEAGMRYSGRLDVSGLQRTIYNLDLSVYRVLNFPPPPTGMRWGVMGYITEALFDTDPSTIEFTMAAVPTSGGGNNALFVFREDGTQLFSKDPGNIVAGLAASPNSYDPIFMVDGQAYMVVHEGPANAPPTRVYALPGKLPCMDCFGSPSAGGIGLHGGPVTDPGSGITVYPNPTGERITLVLGQQTNGRGQVRLIDANGRIAMEQPFSAVDRVEVNVAALAGGMYQCQVLVNGAVLSTLPVVVER